MMKKILLICLILVTLYLVYLNYFGQEEANKLNVESRDIVQGTIDTIKQDGQKNVYTYSFHVNGKKKMGVIVLTPQDELKIEDFMIDKKHINVGVVVKGQQLVSYLALTKE